MHTDDLTPIEQRVKNREKAYTVFYSAIRGVFKSNAQITPVRDSGENRWKIPNN